MDYIEAVARITEGLNRSDHDYMIVSEEFIRNLEPGVLVELKSFYNIDQFVGSFKYRISPKFKNPHERN